jgi:hypothetical protein
VWTHKTGQEFKAKGGEVPHWFLMLIPFVNFFYLWKWAEALEKASGGKHGGSAGFLAMLFGPFAMAFYQGKFNAM